MIIIIIIIIIMIIIMIISSKRFHINLKNVSNSTYGNKSLIVLSTIVCPYLLSPQAKIEHHPLINLMNSNNQRMAINFLSVKGTKIGPLHFLSKLKQYLSDTSNEWKSPALIVALLVWYIDFHKVNTAGISVLNGFHS